MPQGVFWFPRFLREDNNFLDPITNNLDPRNPSYPYSSVFIALLAAIGIVARVKAATDYYVDPSGGNDANSGTISSPWQTFAHAFAVLATLDFFGQTVTLHLVNNATEQVLVSEWTGGGALTVDLGGKTVNPVSGNAFASPAAAIPGVLTVQNGTLACAGGTALLGRSPGTLQFGAGLTFGASFFHVQAVRGVTILIASASVGSYNVSGAASQHYRVDTASTISTGGFNCSIFNTSGGALNFSGEFAHAINGGLLDLAGANYPQSGANNWSTSTGVRYLSEFNGLIKTGGGGPNFFPGNAAGSASNQGIYG